MKEVPMFYSPSISIQTLLPGLPLILSQKGPKDIEITGITHNSQEVKPHSLFVAIRGFTVDGHRYIPDALRRGATCIVLEDPAWITSDTDVLFIQVPDSREALARLAATFYGNPSEKLTLIGITGTNGKTTLTYLLESILEKEGRATGVMGTINYRFRKNIIPAETTTPDALSLQRILGEMLDEKIETVVMEVSSHALALHRIDGCHFDVAVWTNLSQDHLDFHSTMEEYFDTKKTLFTRHLASSKKEGKHAIINIDDPYGRRLAKEQTLSLTTYGTTPRADVHPTKAEMSASGISMEVHTPKGSVSITSSLVGRHNQSNLLAATATALALGIPLETIRDGLQTVTVPGRLETVENRLGITVLVDYAHTPDALKNVLTSLRPLTKGRLITLFGCGGDRDKKKRPKMGKIAEELSDSLILTNDNPRSEPPQQIIQEIESGIKTLPLLPEDAFRSGQRGYAVVPDRKEAIRLAIDSANPGDIVLIAGKGHESYQVIGSKRISFSDVLAAREVLAEKQGQEG